MCSVGEKSTSFYSFDSYTSTIFRLKPITTTATRICATDSTGFTTALTSVITPVFLPTPGLITILNSITIQASPPTASIYYTTDGTIPTTSSNLYTTPIKNVWALAGRQIRAFATNPGYLDR